jgi:hypothetical protein
MSIFSSFLSEEFSLELLELTSVTFFFNSIHNNLDRNIKFYIIHLNKDEVRSFGI